MLIFSSQSLRDAVMSKISTDPLYLSIVNRESTTQTSSMEESLMILNGVVTLQSLQSKNLVVKQKTTVFAPQKTIRYEISPHKNVHIWFAHRPSNSFGGYLTEEDITHKIQQITSDFLKHFNSNELLDELSSMEVFYLNEENYSREFKKILNLTQKSVWAKSKVLDVPNLFPLARSFKRKIVVFAGPTSSGKTYHALALLKAATSGLYLGPLRLNALEVFDDLNSAGVPCNLVTGEEKLLTESARHQASTAEMANYDKEVDITVIDEIQFMDDYDRGWAFCNALIGAPSKFVVVTCPEYAIEKVERLATLLGDDIEVHRLPRKTKLSVTQTPIVDFSKLLKGTAIVSFSRKRVFQLKAELEKIYKVSVVYGGMPPDVRKEQARRFREGQTEVIIATDCIGIGLNLPIQHVIFDTTEKYDGIEVRRLHQAELLQVAGRAGRYKMYDEGFVSGVTWADHEYIKECITTPNDTKLSTKFFAKVPFTTVQEYMQISGVNKLSNAILELSEKISYDKTVYELSPVDLLVENVKLIEQQKLDISIDDVWRIAHIPVEIQDCERTFLDALSCVAGVVKGVYIDTSSLSTKLSDTEKLFQLEKLSVQLDCVNWFKMRYQDSFMEIDEIRIKTLRSQVVKAMNDAVLKLG